MMNIEESIKKNIEKFKNTLNESNKTLGISSKLSDANRSKEKAIEIINKHLGCNALNKKNTHFSKINKSKEVWWFDISPSKFESDLHLILKKRDGFIWIKIKKDSFKNPEKIFRLRTDKNKNLIDLEISASHNNYMKDIRSGGIHQSFRPYIEFEFDSII